MTDRKVRSSQSDDEIRYAAGLFSLLGIGYLFPFSALTQPVDYWMTVFPNYDVEFDITFVYLICNLISVGALAIFSKEPSYKLRIPLGLAGQLIIVTLVPSMYFMSWDETTSYIVLMGLAALAAVATALVDSVAVSFASQYPEEVQVGLQFGIGLSTLIGSIYRVLSRAVFPASMIVSSSMVYFAIGACTIVLCLSSFYHLLALPLSKRVLRFGVDKDYLAENRKVVEADSDTRTALVVESGVEGGTTQRPRRDANEDGHCDNQPLLTPRSYGAMQARNNASSSPRSASPFFGGDEPLPPPAPEKWDVFRRAFFSLFLSAFVFFTTFLMWPSFIAEIPSYNSSVLQSDEWWPLILLLLFSVSDMTGRMFTSYRGCITLSNLWVFVVGRLLILFPLVVSAANGLLFTNDFYSLLFVFLLGFTNGYLGVLAIIMINEAVEPHECGTANLFTGLFLNCGFSSGAMVALALQGILLGHR